MLRAMGIGKEIFSEEDERLRQLILYVSLRSQGDTFFGAVKLNKILFFSDFIAYLVLGKAITGTKYFALPEGPAPRRLLPIRDAMISDNQIVIQQVSLFGEYLQERTIALKQPKLDIFTASQIAIVDWVIDRLRGKTAKEASEESHKFLGWKIAKDKETIPYGAALMDAGSLLGVEEGALTADHIQYGQSLEPLALEALSRHG